MDANEWGVRKQVLNALREESGIDLNETHFSRLLAGERGARISQETIEKYAQALGVDRGWLSADGPGGPDESVVPEPVRWGSGARRALPAWEIVGQRRKAPAALRALAAKHAESELTQTWGEQEWERFFELHSGRSR